MRRLKGPFYAFLALLLLWPSCLPYAAVTLTDSEAAALQQSLQTQATLWAEAQAELTTLKQTSLEQQQTLENLRSKLNTAQTSLTGSQTSLAEAKKKLSEAQTSLMALSAELKQTKQEEQRAKKTRDIAIAIAAAFGIAAVFD